LQEESAKQNVHAYQSYKGSPVLRNSFAAWYKKWYSVELNADKEILPLIGSKEGIMHICMTYLNEDDKVLVPNPGYPTYRSAVKLAGGVCLDYDLEEKNNFYPDFDALEKLNFSGIKMMWANYPQMPTGKKASAKIFKQIIDFGKKHNILICHDNPYSFILNDEPQSILEIEGALDVTIELNSLSKSHSMAGWRVGVLCANEQRVNEIMRFKSNMDSGMFLPVQLAAAKALSLDKNWYDFINKIYKERREDVYALLNTLNCTYSTEQNGLFVWAKIPSAYKNAYDFSDKILYNSNVFITPGGIFGSNGDEYVRVSLCVTSEKIKEAIERIKKWKAKM
ncbi:MAG TPA: aminotransferase class I/II-fold pyridoxal phosphate-dependent enzyme, partial [Parafilimonas sp.]|nr:aminotransferase class I/II-fold pyridoxal phosphate-dependent enzyme [Parafilimonas sp.]